LAPRIKILTMFDQHPFILEHIMKVKLILEMHEFGSNFIQLGIYLIGNQLMVLNHCFYNRKVECGQSLSPKRSEIRLKKNWLAQVL